MFLKIWSIISSGLKFGFFTLLVVGFFAYLAAPVFFGIVIITAGVVMTVYVYSAIGFMVGVILKWFLIRRASKEFDELL